MGFQNKNNAHLKVKINGKSTIQLHKIRNSCLSLNVLEERNFNVLGKRFTIASKPDPSDACGLLP